MKKVVFLLAFTLLSLLCAATVFAEEPTVYVSAAGNDSAAGTSEAPLKTLYAGFRALPNGGRIVLKTPIMLRETVNQLPSVDGLVTVTAVGDKDYRASGAGIYLSGNVHLKSAVKFENLHIVTSEKNLVFLCNGYYACFGEGLEVSLSGAEATYPSIAGGTQGRLPAEGTYVEIHSGTWLRARGGARGTGAVQSGDITFAIFGGTFTSTVDLGGDSDVNGNAAMYVYGGNFQAGFCLASDKSIRGNVTASIYGGNFKSGIRLSRGGTIGGNCDVYILGDITGAVYPGTGSVQGNTTVYLAENTSTRVAALPTQTISAAAAKAIDEANETAMQTALAKELVILSECFFHERDQKASGTAQKTADTISCGDINGDGKISLADVLLTIQTVAGTYTAAADIDGDGKVTVTDIQRLLKAMLQGANSVVRETTDNCIANTLSLYGGATAKDGRITKGFAFGTANTANYTVYSDVTLGDKAIVGLFFGCDNADPQRISGYYFEVNTLRGTLAAYSITDGNYRTVGEKKLDLLANTARIYVTYIDGTAELYFDDNPLTESAFFDFDLAFLAKGNAVGIYAENAAMTLPVCVAASKDDAPTYTNDILNQFNDPEIFYENGMYYIFGGGSSGVQLYTTPDFQAFHYCGTVIEKGDAFGDKEFVAGNIVRYGDYYYLFYLAYSQALGRSTTACAAAASITGPYKNATQQPLVSNSDIIGGQPFVDEDGTVYLVYTRTTGGNQTYGAKVILKDGTAELDLSGEKLLLTVTEEWEYARACVVECGFIVQHNSLYYLIYAGGNYNSTYGVGYAISENPLGPYTKYACNPILNSNDQSFGVGAASVFPSPDGSEHFIIYLRSYSYAATRPLQTCIDRIRFVKDPRGGADILEIAGPTVNPQPIPSGIGKNTPVDYQYARFHW